MSDAQDIFKLYLESSQSDQMRVDEWGTKRWYLNDKLHRIGAPAIEWYDGVKTWAQHGKLHREDGPAIDVPHNISNNQWWFNDKRYDFASWVKQVLIYQGLEPTQNNIDAKIAEVMSRDLFD
jgi:hypothetical protein